MLKLAIRAEEDTAILQGKQNYSNQWFVAVVMYYLRSSKSRFGQANFALCFILGYLKPDLDILNRSVEWDCDMAQNINGIKIWICMSNIRKYL